MSMDKPLATQQGKRRHHSSHAAITQAYTNNHHTITLTTQAWSWSLTACSLTHTHTRAKAGQGAHHHQANGVDGLHSDHGVAQAWLWCGVAIKPCATRGGTHAIQVVTCSPHCPTTTTTPVLSGVNTRATTSPHPSPRVCVWHCAIHHAHKCGHQPLCALPVQHLVLHPPPITSTSSTRARECGDTDG